MSRNFFSSYSFLESVRFGPAVRYRFLGNSVPVHMESAANRSLVKWKVQIDRNAKHLGRRTPLDLALVGDVQSTLASLLPRLTERKDARFLEKHLGETRDFEELLNHYVEKGPGIKPIRPEFLAATLSDLAAPDACSCGHRTPVFGPPGTLKVETSAESLALFRGLYGQRCSQCFRRTTRLSRQANNRALRRRRLHHACTRRCAYTGSTQGAGRSNHPEQ